MGGCLDTDINPKNLCHETHTFQISYLFSVLSREEDIRNCSFSISLTSLIQSSAWRIDLHVIWTLSPIFFMTGNSNDILSKSPGFSTHTMAKTYK